MSDTTTSGSRLAKPAERVHCVGVARYEELVPSVAQDVMMEAVMTNPVILVAGMSVRLSELDEVAAIVRLKSLGWGVRGNALERFRRLSAPVSGGLLQPQPHSRPG